LINAEAILNIIQNLNEALIALDFKGNVRFWNKGAETLFGYTQEEALGKPLPFISRDSFFELETAFEKTQLEKSYTFKTQKYAKDGTPLDLVATTSPWREHDKIIGMSAVFVDLNKVKRATFIPYNLMPFLRDSKRTFGELRDIIMVTLSKGKMTINHIANESGVNWRTVEKHLTYLIGKRMVEELFSSEYIRIFELTDQGRVYVEQVKQRELAKIVKKDEA